MLATILNLMLIQVLAKLGDRLLKIVEQIAGHPRITRHGGCFAHTPHLVVEEGKGEFESPEDARRAILELNDSELEGRPLQVREDREDRDLK